MKNKMAVRAGLAGLVAWLAALILALKFGASASADAALIAQLRLPRAVLASAIGIGLSVSGAALQALFSNPLCEPYTLGISSGAALGAVIGATLGLDMAISGLAGSAFAGALVFAAFLYVVARKRGSGNLALLLAGVMLGFFGSSLVALWMALADSNGVQAAMMWLMGDLSRARLPGAIFAFVVSVGLSLLLWTKWMDLDALMMGEEDARALGVPVGASRRKIVLILSLLVGLCVSGGGMIGFVGLVVPHFARRFAGALHIALIPVCAVWGAALLTAADVVARTAVRPYELPVGVVTALVGAPLFLWIVVHRRRER